MIKVLLFAGMADSLKKDVVFINRTSLTAKEVKPYLAEQYPSISSMLQQAILAVNEELVAEDTIITQHDIVAVIPPVSGG